MKIKYMLSMKHMLFCIAFLAYGATIWSSDKTHKSHPYGKWYNSLNEKDKYEYALITIKRFRYKHAMRRLAQMDALSKKRDADFKKKRLQFEKNQLELQKIQQMVDAELKKIQIEREALLIEREEIRIEYEKKQIEFKARRAMLQELEDKIATL